MRLATTEDMQRMDQRTIARMSSIDLMNTAAYAVYEELEKRFAHGARILIICGSGNNGGDGYALALHAHKSYSVSILKYRKPQSKDACHFHELALQAGIRMMEFAAFDEFDVIVDAMFGTGLKRAITGDGEEIIRAVNASSAYVISVDIPSGIQADLGKILGCAVCADLSVTFQFAKRGMYLYPGCTCSKEIVVKDIGIAAEDAQIKQPIAILDEKIIRQFLPKRTPHSHKGTYGNVLMIGGSASMHGAITMAADAALHSGLGTLTLMIPEDIREIVSSRLLEAMLICAPSALGYFAEGAERIAEERMEVYDLIVIGCGMGRNTVGEKLVQRVLATDKPCVIDGDALYLLGRNLSWLKRSAPVILTPHPKEFSYLCHRSVEEILQDPIAAARDFLQEYPQVTLVEKDERTLIFHRDAIYLNIRGNNALAKGGSGDVLCGLISGLFAQSKEPLTAACSGVFLHALCAEILAREHSLYTILPHQLCDVLDRAFQLITMSEDAQG